MIRATVRRSGCKPTSRNPNKPDDANAETILTSVPADTSLLTACDDLLKRITADERILGGKPIIRGMRFAVEHILAMLAAGDSADEILRQYPVLEPEDIQACLTFARQAPEASNLADIRTSS